MKSRPVTPIDPRSARWCIAAALSSVLPLSLVLEQQVQLLIALCFALGACCAWLGRRPSRFIQILLTFLTVVAVFWLFGVGFGARSFGRDAGSALLAAMLGLKLMEMIGLRDARSTVAFALFAIMTGFLQDQGPRTLILALLSGLLNLAALTRLADAESPAEGARISIGEGGALNRLVGALRIAALALPLAAAGFFLFPRLAGPMWGLPQNSSESRTGLSENMSPGDISKLYTDDTPIMRVTFDGGIPPAALRYFRGPVLTQFDGRSWTRGFSNNFNAAELSDASSVLNYEIEQEPTERRYLFPLDLPMSSPANARLTHERSVYTEAPLNKLIRQRFESATQYRFQPTLSRLLVPGALALPEGFNPRAVSLAQGWRETLAEPEQIIQAALALFNAEFTYTLEPPLLGRDSVDDFLFETRRGYCEHFSSAFVVLMRAAGLPARVVTGYQGGVANPLGDYLIVRQSDAHAWSEVWLQDRGWVRIDPTSAVAPERIEQGTQSLAPDSVIDDWLQPLQNTVDWMRRGWNDFVLGYNAERQRNLLRPFGISQADWQQLGAALAITTGIAIALTLLLMLRRPPDTRPPIVRAWQQLLRRMAALGWAKAAHEGPTAYAQRVAEHLGEARAPFEQLCQRYSDWRYRAAVSGDEAAGLLTDLRRFKPRRNAAKH